MDIDSSIQESTQRPTQVGGKLVGFNNSVETLMSATEILMSQAKAIVEQEYKKKLDDKDHEISEKDKKIAEQAKQLKELEALLAIYQGKNIISLNTVAPPKREYQFDYTLFPKENGAVIIDCLIELTKRKRENDRFVLMNKTDWLIVVKALRYFGVYIGDEKDFLSSILPNVLNYMDDAKRITQLSADQQNFDTIDPYSPIVKIPVDQWNKKAIEERRNITIKGREGKKPSNANTALNRCMNIKNYLLDILIHHDVQLDNH